MSGTTDEAADQRNQVRRQALRAWAESRGLSWDQQAELIPTHSLLQLETITAEQLANRLSSLRDYSEELADVLNRATAGIGTASTPPAPAPAPAATVPSPAPLQPAAPPAPAAPRPTTSDAAESDQILADLYDPERLRELLDGFTAMDFSGASEDRIDLRVKRKSDELVLRWRDQRAEDSPYVVYRLVSSDTAIPYSPEVADVLAVTTGSSFTDTRAMVTGMRHYQLWANRGDDLESAQWEQPVLLGQRTVVADPQDITLISEADTSGTAQVIGSWTLLPGADAVQVFRIPRAQAAMAGIANPAFRICPDDPNRGGFIDTGVVPGDYVYQLVVEATVDGLIQLSTPHVESFQVRAQPVAIEDLACVDHPGAGFSLTWTSVPTGRTVIFRSAEAPLSGTAGQEHPYQALEAFGLLESDVLHHPVTESGPQSRMASVVLPAGWPRAYFTPVHVIGDTALIGRSVLRVELLPVQDARIHQRVSRQIITFGWPPAGNGETGDSQASGISVYETYPGATPDTPINGAPLTKVSKEAYDLEGGIIPDRPLNPAGSSIVLVPYAYAGSRMVTGPATVIPYPGLTQIQYQVKASWRISLRKKRRLEISLLADRDLTNPFRFVLVHNRDRLPLAIDDGETIPVYPSGAEEAEATASFKPTALGPQPTGEAWTGEISSAGFVRVFAMLPAAQMPAVAVLDPAIDTLEFSR